MVPLGIRRSLGRVDVFGFVIDQRATTKGHALSSGIADGEDQPIAEAVVVTIATFSWHRQAARFDLGRLEALGH